MAKCEDAEIAIVAKDKTGDGVKSAKSKIGKLTKTIKNYWAEIAVVAGTIYGAIKAVKSLTDAYGLQEEAETKLTAALKATGRYSESTETALHNFAKEMQNATGIGDELTIAAAGIMTTFTNIATETFPDALEAAANMSKMFGQDLQQSIIQLGTALNDPIAGVGRLKRIGISFSEEQKKSIELFMEQNDIMSAQRVILDELELEIGGVARAMGKTWKGQTEILTAAFGDLKEEMGRVIVNRMEPMLPVITRMVTATKDWIKQKNDLREAYKLVNKEMEGTIKLTRIQLLQAEQDVALHELKKLKKQAELEVTTSTLGSLKTEISTIYDMIAAMENEIETRGKVIHSLLLNMEKAKEGKEAIKDRSDALKDEEEIILEWRDQMALAGLDAAFFTNATQTAKDAIEETTTAIGNNTTTIGNNTTTIGNNMTAIANLYGVYSRFGDIVRENRDAIESYNQHLEDLRLTKEKLQILTAGALTEAFINFANATGTVQDKLKDLIKDALAGILRAIGEQLLAIAAWLTVGFQFGKAAIAAAAGVAAIIASNEVKNWQQGGIIEAQQGYGGGDIVPAMLEPGEMVIPKEVVRNNTAELNAMVSGQGGQGSATNVINVYLDGKKLQGVITKWTENGQLRIAPRAVR